MHSSVVEKPPVVDKTLPPDHFYFAKVPSSGQFPVVDKKFWDTACKTLKSQHFFEKFWTFSCKDQNILGQNMRKLVKTREKLKTCKVGTTYKVSRVLEKRPNKKPAVCYCSLQITHDSK